MPRTARNKEEIQEIRDKILNCSLDIIIDEGFDSLTMRKLGNRIGCAAKTIYNYYGSKEEIYLRILSKGFEILNDLADNAIKGISDPYDRLRALCNVYIKFGLDNVHYYDIMFSWDVPKYTNYVGTYFESEARDEKETAMYYTVIAGDAISEILKKKNDGSQTDEDIAYHLVRMWSELHGFVTLNNSNSFREYYTDTLKFQQRIVDELIGGLTE